MKSAILWIIVITILLFSCNDKSKNKAEYINISGEFLKAYYNGDIERISKYSTPTLQRRLITQMNYRKTTDTSYTFQFVKDSIIDENNVYVFYKWNGDHKLHLIKKGNSWLVSE